jgi:WD40 repeat protein
MANKPSKMVEEADQGHSFFIGGRGKLMQWSISQKKVTKDYGDIMAGSIYSMV